MQIKVKDLRDLIKEELEKQENNQQNKNNRELSFDEMLNLIANTDLDQKKLDKLLAAINSRY
jgi:hypothetical protein